MIKLTAVILLSLFFCLNVIANNNADLFGHVGIQNFSLQNVQSDSTEQNLQVSASNINSKTVAKLNNQYNGIEKNLNTASSSVIKAFQKREARLKKKLQSIDSTKAKELFNNSEQFYNKLQNKVNNTQNTVSKISHYLPGLDSLQTMTKLFQRVNASISGLSPDKLMQMNQLNGSINGVEGSMESASDISQALNQRQQQLSAALQPYGLGNDLLGMNKQVYYYQQQLNEYKSMLQDEDKLEQKALSAVRELPAFQDFMSKNSFISQLFPSASVSGAGSAQALVSAGMQTRSAVQQQLQQQMGSLISAGGGSSGTQILQQSLQTAQQQTSTLQNTVNQYMNGGNSSMVMPEFKPNTQKTKSFLKRIQLGWNMQSSAGIKPNPNTCVFGLTAGYKISNKNVVGVGASYIMGTGTGIDHIQLTNQGLGLRSFLDMKIKKTYWITGGFEYNYMYAFEKFSSIPGVELWQKSALLGVTKKIKLASKESTIQLLYDFLAKEELPQGRSLVFRMGYSF